VKKCVNVLLFLALQMVCFAKTSCYRCDMIPPVFPLWSKGFLDLAGRFCTCKLRDPASCWMVLIAGKSYPKTRGRADTRMGADFFLPIFADPCFLVPVFVWYFLPVTRKKHFGLLFLDVGSGPCYRRPLCKTPETAKYYRTILPD